MSTCTLWPPSSRRAPIGSPRTDDSEFYGLARFDHPSPAALSVLDPLFPQLLSSAYTEPVCVPSKNGESIPQLHDRVAYALHRTIETLDQDPTEPKALLICTHAATMIAIGRALTGLMPEDEGQEDFRCGTCALSVFKRRRGRDGERGSDAGIATWSSAAPEKIPDVRWRDGRGVAGGWDCEVNGDCSFLDNGEERSWYVFIPLRSHPTRENCNAVPSRTVVLPAHPRSEQNRYFGVENFPISPTQVVAK